MSSPWVGLDRDAFRRWAYDPERLKRLARTDVRGVLHVWDLTWNPKRSSARTRALVMSANAVRSWGSLLRGSEDEEDA